MTHKPKDPDILSDPVAQAWRRGELEGDPIMTPQHMTQTQDAPCECANCWETYNAPIAMKCLRQHQVQAIGAAVSRRNWPDTEKAYNDLRDRLDSILAHLRSPAGEVGEQPAPYTCKHGCERDELMERLAASDTERNADYNLGFDDGLAAGKAASDTEAERLLLSISKRVQHHIENPSAWDAFDQGVSDILASIEREIDAALAKGGAA